MVSSRMLETSETSLLRNDKLFMTEIRETKPPEEPVGDCEMLGDDCAIAWAYDIRLGWIKVCRFCKEELVTGT